MKKRSFNSYSRKELLALPHRKWDDVKSYDSVFLVKEGHKHDSEFALIAVVGVKDGVPVEVAAVCDDVEWYVDPIDYVYPKANLRMDMIWPAGVIHAWHNDGVFEVGASLSSTDIKVTHTEPRKAAR